MTACVCCEQNRQETDACLSCIPRAEAEWIRSDDKHNHWRRKRCRYSIAWVHFQYLTQLAHGNGNVTVAVFQLCAHQLHPCQQLSHETLSRLLHHHSAVFVAALLQKLFLVNAGQRVCGHGMGVCMTMSCQAQLLLLLAHQQPQATVSPALTSQHSPQIRPRPGLQTSSTCMTLTRRPLNSHRL